MFLSALNQGSRDLETSGPASGLFRSSKAVEHAWHDRKSIHPGNACKSI